MELLQNGQVEVPFIQGGIFLILKTHITSEFYKLVTRFECGDIQ
jgi:hypothetical protein